MNIASKLPVEFEFYLLWFWLNFKDSLIWWKLCWFVFFERYTVKIWKKDTVTTWNIHARNLTTIFSKPVIVHEHHQVFPHCLKLEYDHYSKRCPSYSIPPIHPDDVPSLLEKVEKRVAVAKEKAEKEAEERRLEKERIEAEQRAATTKQSQELRRAVGDHSQCRWCSFCWRAGFS